MYFTKNDDLILSHFNPQKLNMFNVLHIKVMKISFEIITHHYLVMWEKFAYFCVFLRKYSIKIEALYNKTWRSFWNIGRNEKLQSDGKKYLTKWLIKLMKLIKLNLQKLLLKLLVEVLETNQTSKMELFVKIVNGIKSLTIFTKGFILDVWMGFKYTSVF